MTAVMRSNRVSWSTLLPISPFLRIIASRGKCAAHRCSIFHAHADTPVFSVQVTPNSAIYFYQFSTPAAPTNLTWTTRFTIAAADGSTTSPANQNEPDGQNIPWGTGALVDPSTAVPAPSYLTGGSTSASSGSSASAASATSASTATVESTTAVAGTTATQQTSSAAGASSTKIVTAPAAPSTSATASPSSSNSSAATANGAATSLGSDSYAVRAGAALGVAAFTLAFAL